MPILRVNASPDGPVLHASPASAIRVMSAAARGTGPVIVMVHGFKYDPGHARFCPHRGIFATRSDPVCEKRAGWPRHLGFGQGCADEGLAVAFGWRARGALAGAQQAAQTAGRQLAGVIGALKSAAPARPVHVITHSMGSEVLLEALHHLPRSSVHRALILTAASYQSSAEAALNTPAGRSLELLNITSRENDLFDCIFEGLIPPPVPGDRAVGCGVHMPNAVNIEIDCADTLRRLQTFGGHIAAPRARICHWSAYTRPGVMQFYKHALRNPQAVPLAGLQNALRQTSTKRWARLLCRPALKMPGMAVRA